ncbi:MAG TPA: flagellar type III secretion system pore protein FliP [Dermatophilaceae bacterium]|nr:flagellar type III secretion system pore protein FliP [Dermatophilaceae bacterium]
MAEPCDPGRSARRAWLRGAAVAAAAVGVLSVTSLPSLAAPAGPASMSQLAAAPVLTGGHPVGAQPAPLTVPALTAWAVTRPTAPTPSPPSPPGSVSVEVNGGTGARSQAVNIIVLLTVMSIAPALLLLTTSFTKIAVVLSLTRNALGTPTIPPNQVLAGLALFLSIFVMSPVLSQVNEQGIQPYLKGTISEAQAFERAAAPLRVFMLKQTGKTELQTMIKLSKEKQPATEKDVSLATLIPAFILSELKAAFIIGFVVFVPFLVIDLVVSSTLMSMGMIMLPPIMISLPFKILLFVMVDGWSLIATSLVTSYH